MEADLTTLTKEESYPINVARFHVHQSFGPSIMVDLDVDGVEKIAFLQEIRKNIVSSGSRLDGEWRVQAAVYGCSKPQPCY